MKLAVSLTLCILFAPNLSKAMVPGEYFCTTVATEKMEAIIHRFTLNDDSMVVHSFNEGSPDEKFTIGSPVDDFQSPPISVEDSDLGMTSFKYKFYPRGSNHLIFESMITYSDNAEGIEVVTTLAQLDSTRIATIQMSKEDGFVEYVTSECKLDASES